MFSRCQFNFDGRYIVSAVKLDPPRRIVGDLDEGEHSRQDSINYVDVSSRGGCPWSMLPQMSAERVI